MPMLDAPAFHRHETGFALGRVLVGLHEPELLVEAPDGRQVAHADDREGTVAHVATLAHSGGQTAGVNGAELVEEHGMLLQAATGPIPNLPSLVVGEPVKGSWWGHPAHDEIFEVLNEAAGVGRRRPAQARRRQGDARPPAALARARAAGRRDRHRPARRRSRRSTPRRARTARRSLSFPSWVPTTSSRSRRR